MFGAELARFAITRFLPKDTDISVEFINVDELAVFQSFAGKSYLFAGTERTYNPKDLQSFTLSRFMAPQLMGYQGKAIVIDPDIFAVKDISSIFELNMQGRSIAACNKKDAWDTSFMLMDCAKLTHWKMESILQELAYKKLDYVLDIMNLSREPKESLLPLGRIWNNLDTLTPETLAVHMTNRITQPWSTGLPIDFTRNKMPKIFGIIPREPVQMLLGKYPTRYQKHPDPRIEELFFTLVKEALASGAISKELIQSEINKKHVRSDLFQKIG